jgi:hypothetical protein
MEIHKPYIQRPMVVPAAQEIELTTVGGEFY